MKRTVWLVVFVVLAFGVSPLSCGGGKGNKKTDLADVADILTGDNLRSDVVEAGQFAYPPPALEKKTFTVVVATNSAMGVTGQEFTLYARVARGESSGDVTYAWDYDGGAGTNDGSAATVSFAEPGQYAVAVDATDADGNTARGGVLLIILEDTAYTVGDVDGDGELTDEDVTQVEQHIGGKLMSHEQFVRADVDLDGRLTDFDKDLIQAAVDQGGLAPRSMWPLTGSLGTKVRMIHPELLNPAAVVTVQFGEAEPFIPVRALPGHAVFVLPPDFDSAKTISLKLLVDGQENDSFTFKALAPPAPSPEPGRTIVDSVENLGVLMDRMPELIEVYAVVADVSADERAVLLGMVQVAADSYAANSAAFLEAFNQMEDEGKIAFEQVALANGMDQVLGDMQGLQAEMDDPDFIPNGETSITAGQAATLLSVLCAASNISDMSAQVAEINEIASGYLDWFDWWPLNTVPVVGQVIQFLSGLSNAIGAITDIVDMVSQFVPEIGDMEVEADPGSLIVGETASCEATIEILIGSKLCSDASGAVIEGVMDQMSDALSSRLGKSIPMVGSAFKAADFDRDNMGKVVGLIYDAINAIAGSILDALGIEDLLNSLAEKICDMIDDPNIPLTPDTWTATCGSAGGGSWTCTEECAGTVTVTAEEEVCGETKTGSAGIGCVGCDEDNCTGCCDGGNCVAMGAQSAEKCGKGGESCIACPEYHECVDGECTCTSDCSTPGEKKCVGNDIWICFQLVNNPPCNQWQMSEPCINGAECIDGECVGGCNGDNCEGCCLADATCLAGTSTDFCGKNGETCQYCAGGYDECIDGECVCEPQCEGKECGPDGCDGSCGDCTDGAVCDADGKCQSKCGNGTIDDGEQCESDSDCEEDEVCSGCQCGAPSQAEDCSPPSQDWDGGEYVKQIHIAVSTAPCGCTPGPGYSPTGAVTLDYFPDDGAYEGSLDEPWTGVSSVPEGIIQDMGEWISLSGMSSGIEIKLVLLNKETNQKIAVYFTLEAGYVWNLKIECLGIGGS
jgi:hypothetical protein